MKVASKALCLLFILGAFTSVAKSNTATTRIDGRVTDLFGNPLVAAVIEVTTAGSQKLSTRTKQDGSYVVENVQVGEATLTVKFPEFLPETRAVSLEAEQNVVLDFGLEPGSIADQPPVELSGVVLESSKKPVREATVTVVNAFNSRLIKSVKTDSNGRYRVEFKNGGQYVAYASKPGFRIVTTAVVLPAAMPRKASTDFVLTAGPPL